MNITEIFIKLPVMTALVMMGIAVFGLAGRALPVSDLPNVDFPTPQVTATLPGASPETMAASAATPLERQFATIDSMTSSSVIGATNITIHFTLERSFDAAAEDVQGATANLSQWRQTPSRSQQEEFSRAVNSSSDAFGNAADMLSALCSAFPARFLFVA
jgi:HAE1 family hydrophobic/amphiphilic exporter-1